MVTETGEFFRQLELDRLVFLHCTGEAVGAKLKEMLACPFVQGTVGSFLI